MDLKNIILGIAIMILTIFVVVYGNNLIFEKPQYEDFCGNFRSEVIVNSQEGCEAIGGEWIGYSEVKEPLPSEGYCNIYSKCEDEYDNARESYYKKIFLVALPLGIIIIIVGAFLFGLEAVGAGLMGGGVGTLLYGVGGYWQYSAEVLKFILSLIGLVVVIYVAYWFNRKFEKKRR